MLIVPVIGDKFKTSAGLPAEVLSFTNYKPEGPAVLAETTEGGTSESILFSEISEINGHLISLVKNADGYNVFEVDGFIPRKFQLPQPGDIIESDISGVETRRYEVQRLRVHVKDQYARGMIIDSKDLESEEVIEITLGRITNIEHYLFSKQKFLAYYSDYAEKGAA